MPDAYRTWQDSQTHISKSLRILIAEDEPDVLELYQLHVTALGHQVVGAATDGKELIARCLDCKPDLVIADIVMPEVDGIQAADEIAAALPVPIILISGVYDANIMKRACLASVMAYLIKPVSAESLKASIAVAVSRFSEWKALVDESSQVQQSLHERKVIEKAKGLLMQHGNLGEAEAYRRLQEMAWTKNQKLIKIAETLVMADEVMHDQEKKKFGLPAKPFTPRRRPRR